MISDVMALIDSQRSDIATAHIMFYLIDFPKSVLKAVSEDQVLAAARVQTRWG